MELPGYRIIRKIAQGGMSTVYLAIQLSVGREVALKVMSPALNADPVYSERFQREANIVGQLSHPNIVAIYDIGRHEDYNYIAMDYLPGGSITDKLKAGISVQEALRITREIAKALDHAHEKGYIHRDIKPENILFREDQSAVITDFGVAKTVASASRMTNAGTVVGTPHYMSPEQVRGRPVDGRADIYSLGVVFFEMLTGTVPFDAEESVAVAVKHLTAPIPRLPAQYLAYQKIVDSALAKEPNDRYQRGSDLVAAIDALDGSVGAGERRYTTATDSTHVQLISLLGALLSTSYQAVREQFARLVNFFSALRWTPRRGIYRHPRVRVLDVQQGGADTGNVSQRDTVVSTRVQEAVHSRTPLGTQGWLSRFITLAVFCALIWGAFSFALQRFELPGEALLPQVVQRSAINTAHWLGARDPAPVHRPTSRTQNREFLQGDGLVRLLNLNVDFLTQEPQPEPESETEPAPEQEPQQAQSPNKPLRVEPQPENAKVRILNIADRYYPGIELLPGRYHIEVTHPGFDMKTEWVEIQDEPLTVSISLKKSLVPGSSFRNDLAIGGVGPEMVIVPAGSFTLGSKLDTNTMPEREIVIPEPFGISKFEVTFADYDKFAEATKRGVPGDSGWGRDSRPVVHVSWYDARAYAEWLSEQTGANYRLPTEAEWAYAARAGTQTEFWWGDEESASGMANCRRGCDSEYAGIFVSRTAPVGSYPANAFGLHDTAGNAAEWVQDCYRNHLLEVPENGDAFSPADCAMRTLRGGSMNSRLGRIASHVRESAPPRTREDYLGFRVVVELY